MVKVAFIQNIAYEYLGLMYLSSILKERGHEVEVFIGNGNKKMLEQVIEYNPSVVGFSCSTGLHKWSLSFAKEIKKSVNAFILFGGPHPTFFPEIINEPEIDGVCIGEGEFSLLELSANLSDGKDVSAIKNFWFKSPDGKIIKNEPRPLIEDLDRQPFPDRDLYYSKYPFLNKSQKAFITARGCPFNCSFCYNHSLKKIYAGKGKYVRRRSVGNVITEIKEVSSKYILKTVYIMDDTFTFDKDWIREFFSEYKKEINLPLICLIRADMFDEDIAKWLKAANCIRVFFGIESGDEGLRNNLLSKGVTDEEIMITAELLKKYKIPFRTYNMMGLPGETLEQAFKTIDINTRIKTDYPWCSIFQPYPKTVLGEFAITMGYFDKNIDLSESSFFKKSFLKSESSRELENLQKLFFWAVKFSSLKVFIKKIIKFPSNFIFDILFLISYGYCYFKSENVSIKELIVIGVNNIKRFFFSSSKHV